MWNMSLAVRMEQVVKTRCESALSMEEGVSSDKSSGRSRLDSELAGKYERYVKKAKHQAMQGNLLKSIELFRLANDLHSSEKLIGRIQKLEEALEQIALQKEEEDDEFVDVLNSGFMLYKELYSKLFQHQREGVAFLYGLYRDGRKGGILADDMGLGKTIQIIAFLSGMYDAQLAKHVLLIMPTTLIQNWIKEFAKWTPGMRVNDFHGTSKKERTKNLEKTQRKGGIIITTYQMLINNWQQLSSYNGREFVWDYIILDEAHKIKTSSTKTTKSCHLIPAKNRLLLTGTPIQNNLHEMWSLYDFACRGTLLGTSKTFKMEFENPITRAREKDSTPGEKALGLKISENLMKIIKPYFLRRTKDDVKNPQTPEQANVDPNKAARAPSMPSLSRKNDFIVWVYLSLVQEEVYKKFISLDQIKELLMTTRSPLAELNILKKLCDHPRLLSARACIQLGLEGDDQCNEEGDHAVTKYDHLSDETLIEESGKLLFLMDLLHKLKADGHRTLVFSQSRKMLDMIDRILKNKGFKIMRIDGTVTDLTERERRISRFQSSREYSVLLLTTQVGGVGLTLTAADRVVIFDPSWNPATDAQAVDRAYRIGQKQDVVIYRLITCGTVEERIYRRQIFKDSLIRQTTGDKKNPFRYFSRQELRELFSLDNTRTSSTQIQLQTMHAAQRKTDTRLDEHIAYLHSLAIFGISDHDLIYSHEAASQDEEDYYENEQDGQYIQQRVRKANELVQLESQMNEQLIEQNRACTEGAWSRQTVVSDKPKKRSLPNVKQYISPPVMVDVTEDDIANVSCQMTSMVMEDSSEDTDEKQLCAPHTSNAHESELTKTNNSNSFPPIRDSLLAKNVQQKNEKRFAPAISPPQILDLSSPEAETSCINTGVTVPPARHASNGQSVVENIGCNVSIVGKSFLALKPEPGMQTNVRHSNGLSNVTGVFQKPGIADASLDIKDGLQASLSQSMSQLPCDFNLVLEDSMENQSQVEASMEYEEELGSITENSMAHEKEEIIVLDDSMENASRESNVLEASTGLEREVENISDAMENSNLQLKVESSYSESEKSNQELVEDLEKSNHEDGVKGNGLQSYIDIDSEEEVCFSKKRAANRIDSDSETESSECIVAENEMASSPFHSPSMIGISASTPKFERSLTNLIFPSGRNVGGRRSIASRRSLVHVAVEEVQDVEETIASSSSEDDEPF
ncbi:DNA excision repair protein ERCC-6-like isoform X2 [Ascaphus truei]|uniref:DNA excision repair protein ERCC-6-like isoform X2 n=1 Tax=Ascaphus truei TaxID=8439 RepID=UPI003F59E995